MNEVHICHRYILQRGRYLSMEIILKELKKKSNEILCNPSEEGYEKVIEAVNFLLQLSKMARNEGLLALEEAAEGLNKDDDTLRFLHDLIILIVDGTEPDCIREMGLMKCCVYDLPAYDGWIMLMYLQGTLMIQAGSNTRLITEYVKAMMPKNILTVYEAYEAQLEKHAPNLYEVDQSDIEAICATEEELDEEDYSLLNQSGLQLLELTDKNMQILLEKVKWGDLAIALKGMPGQVRTHVFNNLSQDKKLELAGYMKYLGPVRMKDVEDSCSAIMQELVRLVDIGEINDQDLAVIKVLLNMQQAAGAHREKMREKYMELKKIIDQIYGRN